MSGLQAVGKWRASQDLKCLKCRNDSPWHSVLAGGRPAHWGRVDCAETENLLICIPQQRGSLFTPRPQLVLTTFKTSFKLYSWHCPACWRVTQQNSPTVSGGEETLNQKYFALSLLLTCLCQVTVGGGWPPALQSSETWEPDLTTMLGPGDREWIEGATETIRLRQSVCV